jgi:hypothetical protein
MEDGRRTVWLAPAGLLVASWLAIAALSLRLPAGAQIAAVIFPPWWSAQQVLSAAASAHAAIVRAGAIPSILIVQPASGDGLARLRDAGVWFAVNPQAIGGCLTQ